MKVTLTDYPRISGNYVKQPNFVNNRAWWRNGAFAIWFDGESGKQADWVIGLAKNLRAKLGFGTTRQQEHWSELYSQFFER